ncbi:MAG TPA: hypothetical protein V6C89_21680 [Drouetiella sp.]
MYKINLLANNEASSWFYRALGELAMLTPPLSETYTAEALVALKEVQNLLTKLSIALPSENFDNALGHIQKCRVMFDESRFVQAQNIYSDALAELCSGGLKKVTCVIRRIGGDDYFCWDFPKQSEQFYTFTGSPRVHQIDGNEYLIWMLVLPNKIKLRTHSE